MKILFVINTMGLAGAEIAMTELMKALCGDNEVYLYSLINRGEAFTLIPDSVKVLGPPPDPGCSFGPGALNTVTGALMRAAFARGGVFKNFGYLAANAIPQIKSDGLKPYKLCWKLLADGAERFDTEFDLAVAYIEGGSTHYVAKHVRAKRKVAFVHIDYLSSGNSRDLDLDSYSHFHNIYAVSNEVRESFLTVYPEYANKTAVFHNMYDIEGIKRRGNEAGGFEDDFDGLRILTIGRLAPQKSYEVAIEALKYLEDKGYNIKWYALGDGPERKRLKRLIKKFNLEDKFILLGQVINPYPYIKQCELYVHATRFEGKSIAVGEAQILGKPIIVSDRPGNREQVIHGEDGLLIDLNPKSIAEAIILLIGDEALRNKLAEAAGKRKINYPEDLAMLLN